MTRSKSTGSVACVFPHSDDLAIFAGGLVSALVNSGKQCYFIRVTDDDKDSWALSEGETARRIELETSAAARALGLAGEFRLGYPNHYLDESSTIGLRHRLITLFRYLQPSTVITFDPWALYEENPDHHITGKAADQACWMSQRINDLPELSPMGIKPWRIRTRIYVGRGVQARNYHFNATQHLHAKRRAILCHETPLRNMVMLEKAGTVENLAVAALEAESIGDGVLEAYVDKNLLEPRCNDCERDLNCEPFHVIGEKELLPNE